jgi:hypothetical protein
MLLSAHAHAEDWQVTAAGGGDLGFTPEVEGHGFGLADLRRPDMWHGGDFHLQYNTDTLQVGLERIELIPGKLQLWVIARGEAIFAGILRDYYQRGLRIPERGFDASFVHLLSYLQYHPAPGHTLELRGAVRRWFFGAGGQTAEDFVLPPETWVIEPRVAYQYWNVDAPSSEWEPHRFFPRIEGISLRIVGRLDYRTDTAPWGAQIGGRPDPRNRPDDAILIVRERLDAGLQVGPLVRLQLQQHARWGEGEDDITRMRVGGMNPYVVAVPGLPWASLLSGRLLAAQGSVHVALGSDSRHELGLLVAGGAFNDIRRQGNLDSFGGAGGLAPFADLRFGPWQIHARFGWAVPTEWQRNDPHLSGMVTFGARLL